MTNNRLESTSFFIKSSFKSKEAKIIWATRSTYLGSEFIFLKVFEQIFYCVGEKEYGVCHFSDYCKVGHTKPWNPNKYKISSGYFSDNWNSAGGVRVSKSGVHLYFVKEYKEIL